MSTLNRLPVIECTVTFLPASEGGRISTFPRGALSGDTYRPHLVVGDPSQRQAVIVNGNVLMEEYVGVAFHEGPPETPVGVPLEVTLTPIFYPHPVYDRLIAGATFTVREGAKIIGYGTVKRWVNQTA